MTQDEKILNDQKEILAYIKIYSENLFANKDSFLEDVNLAELLKKANIRTASDHELGNLITTPELGQVLKAMKHNKTPGMDGITTEILKFFWAKLKYFVTNAINCCFLKGKLSTTLRQSIITCIPKGDKDRSQMKNWRPISLLCTTYKLASGVIAMRIKSILDNIISTRGECP